MTMTMGELFDPAPAQWGLRGDPYAWAAVREHLALTPVPAHDHEVQDLLFQAFLMEVGVDLRTAGDDHVYREEFAHGGMSGGHIHLPTWRERLVPLLVDRAQTRRGQGPRDARPS